MDWISKLEKEKNEEEQAKERNKKEKAEELRKEEAAFALVKEKLCPVIKSTIAALNSRVGIELVLHESTTSIEVTKRQRDDLVNPHRLVISNPSENGGSVFVRAIQSRKSHRPELDDVDKSNWSGNHYDDMYGRDVTIVEARADLTDLLESDLQLLMEWLSKTKAYDDSFGTPQIRAVRTKNEKKEVYTNYGQKNAEKSGCFIATAVYGDILAPEVVCLRQYRDTVLNVTKAGRTFITFYYFISPPLAQVLSNSGLFKGVIRKCILDPVVSLVKRHHANL